MGFAPGEVRQEGRRVKRVAKKLAPSAEQTVIDPDLPKSGNLGYRVSRYELALEYKGAINRLAGAARLAAGTPTALEDFPPDLSAELPGSRVWLNGGHVAPFPCRERKLRI